MKFMQRKNKWLPRLMLLVALCTQGILAAHACVAPSASAAQSLSMDAVVAAMPCHEAEKSNANACLMHCTQSDQLNLDQHTVEAVSVDEVVLSVAMPRVQQLALTANHSPLVLNSGPPLSIRYCSFLI